MNKVELMGRLTRNPETRYSSAQDGTQTAITRYTLAVDRRMARQNQDGQQTADFIPCVCFGKTAEFAQKYFVQGIKIAIVGRIQTGSYTDKDGRKVYTTDVVVEEQEFAESKNASSGNEGGYTGGNYNRPAAATGSGTTSQQPRRNLAAGTTAAAGRILSAAGTTAAAGRILSTAGRPVDGRPSGAGK